MYWQKHTCALGPGAMVVKTPHGKKVESVSTMRLAFDRAVQIVTELEGKNRAQEVKEQFDEYAHGRTFRYINDCYVTLGNELSVHIFPCG